MFSRRDMLAVSAAGAVMTASAARAASFGNPDLPPQGAVNAKGPGNLRDPGPQSEATRQAVSLGAISAGDRCRRHADGLGLIQQCAEARAERRLGTPGDAGRFRDFDHDHGRQHAADGRRHQGVALAPGRRVGDHDLRQLSRDGSRRPGRPYVADVNEGDLWYFPAGQPHSLQGLGPDGCEFVICFDDGDASEFNTLLVTDWFAHTPPEVLAKNFGVPAQTFAKIPLQNLWIFQGTLPGDLAADRAAISNTGRVPPHPFIFRLGASAPTKESKGGNVRVADSSNFIVSTTIAAALVTVRPGGVREMHWHPNADEWQYYIKGKGRMTVFNTGPNAMTMDFNAGDIGYVKKNLGHYVENVGDTDLVFIGVFRAPEYQEISLSNWLTHTPPALVAQHLNIDEATIAKWPDNGPGVMPKA